MHSSVLVDLDGGQIAQAEVVGLDRPLDVAVDAQAPVLGPHDRIARRILRNDVEVVDRRDDRRQLALGAARTASSAPS